MSFVYILQTGQFAKIGYSKNPAARLKLLARNLPEPATIMATFPGGVALENKLHRYFSEYHLHSEWFSWCPKLDALVKFGLPDLSSLPSGSPFSPGRNTPEYPRVMAERVRLGLAHEPIRGRRSHARSYAS
jgi:hypothetical protein